MIRGAFWTAEARADLRELVLYLAEYDPAVARKAAQSFFARGNRLVDLPGLGRPGAEPGTRELSVPRWQRVMVYRIADDQVEILALRNTRRQLPENT
jgi:toxin ParE1/3/4